MFTTHYPTLFDRMLDWSRQMDAAVATNPPGSLSEAPVRSQLWIPAIDVYETDTAFMIEADLPGVNQENVDVQFDRGALTISGTRAATLPAQENAPLRVFSSERVSGAFSRSIRLPEHVDAEHIEARYSEGVLALTVPKSKGALPRKIAIKGTEGTEGAAGTAKLTK